MNKKRVMIAGIAGAVLLVLIVVGVVLLVHEEPSASGTVNGTVGVSTISIPENLGNMEFGIALAQAGNLGAGSGTAGSVKVKNGNTVTIPTSATPKSVKIEVIRYFADDDYKIAVGDAETVYAEEIPVTLEWNYADVLSTVDWSDDYFDGHEIETQYECTYSDSCLGQYYITQINVLCPEGKEYHTHFVYVAGITVGY